jgi:deferrochelatase/peroxidase EfeB
LRKLEVPADALGTFPTAFQQGMWREWRARELGDTEKNAPETWSWGGNEGAQRADAVVLIYAEGAKFLEKKSDEIKRAAAKHGHEVRTVSLTGPLPAMRGDGGRDLPREPFGFADGVSQPVIRGAPRKNARAVGNDLVAPGEIVLGYPDNIGTLPPSPSLADTHDPRRYLPDRGPDPFRRRPEFSRYEGTTGERDLGANGTFLVVRQLAQDRAAFDISIDKIYKSLVERRDVIMTTDSVSTSVVMRGILQAGRPAATPGSVAPPTGTTAPVGASNASITLGPYVFGTGYTPPTTDIEIRAVKDLIAAKIVGRWQNGTSLVRNPQFPASLQNGGARPDNAFRLGAEDARGLGCPFGSHIRRANPRDTRFHANTEESRVEIEGVNRHRILRIGRGYDYDDKAQRHAGLFFMCLNADIERQFEFIQKTWLLNRNIHGLENEVDPIMGRGRRSFTIPTPNGPLRLDIDHDFVHMIGGGYFFMPGRAALRYLTRDIQPKSRGPFAGE